MPTDPPTSLKNCILKAEYQAFARTVNESIRWNSLGFEAILYTLICLIFPPYSEYWMVPSPVSSSRLTVPRFAVA
jgi:hypothetical protein